MKETIRKFIKEYKERIEDCDTILDVVRDNKRKLRKDPDCGMA